MTPGFHLYLPQMRMTHDAIVERALAAEAAGFEGIAFMDHLAPPLALDQPMWEALSIAAWVLANTRSLVAGHLVLCDTFRHPAVLARQITSLDHASGGRIELGIGWGSIPSELETFGVGSMASDVRVGRLAESLEIMRALWSGEVVDYEGEHFTLVGAQQQPVPTRPIPITVGGVGRRTQELVRAHAQWWNIPVNHLERLDELRQSADGTSISIQVMVALVPEPGARQQVTDLVQRRFGGTTMAENMVVGTTDELTEHFDELNGSGIERFYAWFADFAPVDTLRRFGDVISAVSGGSS